MEVRKGYKQTEVGVIPEDWEIKLIEEISDVKSGKRLPLGKSLTDERTTHPYIRVTDMFQGGVSLGEIKFVPEDVFPSIKNYRIYKDDIFISVAGTLGIIGKIPFELEGANLTENADRLTNIICDRDFLLYFLSSSFIQNTIEAERTLGAQPKLALIRIRNFQIPLPPTKSEQTAIATALSDADALISSLEKLIGKKRAIKQGAMQELLKPKEGWEMKKLGEIGECIIGLTYRPDNVKESGLLVMRSCNIQNNALSFENNVFVDVEVSEKLTLKGNDILICVRNGSRDLIGKCALIKGKAVGETFGAFMSVFRSSSNEFVFHLFQSDIIKKQIDEHLGATINQITNKSLNSFEIPFPSLDEQTLIVTILSDMDAEIAVLEQKLGKYKLIKQGMMQELLTGRVRLV